MIRSSSCLCMFSPRHARNRLREKSQRAGRYRPGPGLGRGVDRPGGQALRSRPAPREGGGRQLRVHDLQRYVSRDDLKPRPRPGRPQEGEALGRSRRVRLDQPRPGAGHSGRSGSVCQGLSRRSLGLALPDRRARPRREGCRRVGHVGEIRGRGTLDHPSRIFLVDPEGRRRDLQSRVPQAGDRRPGRPRPSWRTENNPAALDPPLPEKASSAAMLDGLSPVPIDQ